MQKKIFTGLLCFILALHGFAQQAIENNAFQAGEELTYRVFYSSYLGDFTAGTAVVSVKSFKNGNREMFHVTGTGSTKGFFDWFFKVRDRFDSYFDEKTILPDKFLRFTNEGNYHFEDKVEFDRDKKLAYSSKDTTAIPADVHDIITAVFFLRTLDVDIFSNDSLYTISFFLDDSVYKSVIRYDGRGVYETRWGKIPCIKVSPRMTTGKVFSDKYPMSVWVTDDENKIPVFAESKIIVGTVKMELLDFKGLKSPFIRPVIEVK